MTKKASVYTISVALVMALLSLLFVNSASDHPSDYLASDADTGSSFIVVGDLHFGHGFNVTNDGTYPETLADIEASNAYTRNQTFIQVLNALPNSATRMRNLGFNPAIQALIVSGDMTENGQNSEWAAFEKLYGGPTRTSRISIPVLETTGNHEYPWSRNDSLTSITQTQGRSLRRIADRNLWRAGSNAAHVIKSSPAGHYVSSFPSNNLVIIHLGAKVSDDTGEIIHNDRFIPGTTLHRNINTFESLKFMRDVLADSRIVHSDTRVLLNFHYPIFHGRNEDSEKTAFYDALKHSLTANPRQGKVIGMFSAHRHKTHMTEWCGLPVFEGGTPLQLNENGWAAFALVNVGQKTLRVRSVQYDVNKAVVFNPTTCNLVPPAGSNSNPDNDSDSDADASSECYSYVKMIRNIDLDKSCDPVLGLHKLPQIQ